MEQSHHSTSPTNYLSGPFINLQGQEISLPDEVLQHICSFLTLPDLQALACTNRRAKDVVAYFPAIKTLNDHKTAFKNAQNLNSLLEALLAFSQAELPYPSIQIIYPSLKTSIQKLLITPAINTKIIRNSPRNIIKTALDAIRAVAQSIEPKYHLPFRYIESPLKLNQLHSNKVILLEIIALSIEDDYIFDTKHLESAHDLLATLISENTGEIKTQLEELLSYLIILEVLNNIKIQARQHATQQTPPSNTTI